MKQKYPGQASILAGGGPAARGPGPGRIGQLPARKQLIGATPTDCYGCLLERAHIAEMRGEQARADSWFARARHRQRLRSRWPIANGARCLLARGKPDAAIEKFKLANQKGPHFADPLEGWGEALMAKNQSHLALAKFAEAEKYAPNWGRLHLKWGEALVYAGKRDEATRAIRPRRRPRSHALRKIRTGEGHPWLTKPSPLPKTADPAAVSLALAGASREEADAFLRDQRHHLHEQLKQIHLDICEKWLGVLLRVATLCVGVAVACFVAAGGVGRRA